LARGDGRSLQFDDWYSQLKNVTAYRPISSCVSLADGGHHCAPRCDFCATACPTYQQQCRHTCSIQALDTDNVLGFNVQFARCGKTLVVNFFNTFTINSLHTTVSPNYLYTFGNTTVSGWQEKACPSDVKCTGSPAKCCIDPGSDAIWGTCFAVSDCSFLNAGNLLSPMRIDWSRYSTWNETSDSLTPTSPAPSPVMMPSLTAMCPMKDGQPQGRPTRSEASGADASGFVLAGVRAYNSKHTYTKLRKDTNPQACAKHKISSLSYSRPLPPPPVHTMHMYTRSIMLIQIQIHTHD
jgi:hypothetical protein